MQHRTDGLAILLSLTLWLTGCQTESITRSNVADETFYLQNAGAAMRVSVKGNTASNTFMIIVHGGPGGTAYFYRTEAMKSIVESKFAVVYWDQRSAGASQGGSLGNTLTLDQYADDLKTVIQTITHRYGATARVFIMGHSWGGLLTSAFLTTGTNQRLVKGWLFVNASHNFPLNDELTRKALLQYGGQQLALKKNTETWQRIVDYSKGVAPPFTLPQSSQLNTDAFTAMTLIDGFTPLDEDEIVRKNLISERIPFTAAFSSLIATDRSPLPPSLLTVAFTSALSRVTVPVLVCSGAYDFVCPKELGDDLLARIGSTKKQQLIFANSGHNLEEQDAYCHAIATFIRVHQ